MIQNKQEVQKLKKLFDIDVCYFNLAAFDDMRKMVLDFVQIDGGKYEFEYILQKSKSKIKISEDAVNSRAMSTLNKIQKIQKDFTSEHFLKWTNYYEKNEILKVLYELCFIISNYVFANLMYDEFYDMHKIFNPINRIYYVQIESIEKFNHINLIREHISEIETGIKECKDKIDGPFFKNRSLKYDISHEEYERRYWKLTEKQKQIVDKIYYDLSGCYLIEGEAGSGKSITLLSLYQKISKKNTSESSYFLTYNNSLIRFYRSGLLNDNMSLRCIKNLRTVNKFMLHYFYSIFPEITVEINNLKDKSFNEDLQNLLKRAVSIYNENNEKTCLEIEYISNQIEANIFENCLDKKDCIEQYGSSELYEISMIYRFLMDKSKTASINYAIIKSLEYLCENDIDGIVDYILIDEAQDLSFAMLSFLSKSAKKALIMASDPHQCIYLKETSIYRLNIDCKIFHMQENLRNPDKLKVLSDAYLKSFNEEGKLKKIVFDDALTGMRPHIFQNFSVEDTINLLLRKLKVDIEEFELDLKDIFIICPSQYVVNKIIERCEYPSVEMKDESIDFSESKIKISTVYLCKGTCFAYVYLFLSNKIFITSKYDKEAQDEIMKNIIYVALTRSMNSLNIFIPKSRTPLMPIKHLLNLMV